MPKVLPTEYVYTVGVLSSFKNLFKNLIYYNEQIVKITYDKEIEFWRIVVKQSDV